MKKHDGSYHLCVPLCMLGCLLFVCLFACYDLCSQTVGGVVAPVAPASQNNNTDFFKLQVGGVVAQVAPVLQLNMQNPFFIALSKHFNELFTYNICRVGKYFWFSNLWVGSRIEPKLIRTGSRIEPVSPPVGHRNESGSRIEPALNGLVSVDEVLLGLTTPPRGYFSLSTIYSIVVFKRVCFPRENTLHERENPGERDGFFHHFLIQPILWLYLLLWSHGPSNRICSQAIPCPFDKAGGFEIQTVFRLFLRTLLWASWPLILAFPSFLATILCAVRLRIFLAAGKFKPLRICARLSLSRICRRLSPCRPRAYKQLHGFDPMTL